MSYLQDKQDLKMANYFQAPNEIIDSIVGTVLSANAAWVVMTVWRYTEGMTDRSTGEKRKKAPIPTKTFMRVLGINRDKTVYKYVNEAIESGLILAEKEPGKVTQYSINHHCELWHGNKKVVAENAPSQVVAESATGGEKRPEVVAKNAPATTGEKRHTYKERVIKEIYINKNKEKSKKEKSQKPSNAPEKPEQVSDQVWSDLLTLRKTKKAPFTVTAWNQAYKQILIAQEKTNHSIEQIISEWICAGWVGFKSEWYINRVGARPSIDRNTDKLAVNNQWRQGESNIVEANTDINDMLGGA